MSDKPVLGKHFVDRYVGDRKEQLRHGHGIYTYENKFFKYQGQWENGLKNGHGRLTMADGGFYEGTFAKGEIEGHGYRYYGHTGDSYTGQFREGERHGQGVLKTAKGSQYEGTWVHGKMEGSGLLSAPDGSVYEGEFHNNKKHGEGVQMYSNTVYYEGGWVEGKRHGQGIFRSEDGSVYNGQWRADVCHGEGSMVHSSGVTYAGMWMNGRPVVEPVAMKYLDDGSVNNELVVEQGKTFDVQLSCVDASGEVVTLESGRSLMIQAGVSKTGTKKRHQLSKTATSLNIFESLLPYELLQIDATIHSLDNGPSHDIPESNVTPPAKSDPPPPIAKTISIITETTDPELGVHSSKKMDDNEEGDLHTSSMVLLHTTSPSPSSKLLKLDTPLSNAGTKSLSSISKRSIETQEDEFLSTLIPPTKVSVKDGIAVFKDLFLPPPPPPDLSNLLISTTSPSKEQSSPVPFNDTLTNTKKQKAPNQSVSQSNSKTQKVNTGVRTTSRLSSEKEKLLHAKREKFCAPGTYVLRIYDITDPPFMGSKLADLFVQVKVVSQKASPLTSSKTASRGKPSTSMNDSTK